MRDRWLIAATNYIGGSSDPDSTEIVCRPIAAAYTAAQQIETAADPVRAA
jgi:hypothetical protein